MQDLQLRHVLLLVLIVPLLTTPATVYGQEETPEPVETVFDHRGGGPTSYTLLLTDGELFTITVSNTCLTEFVYEVLGVGSSGRDQLPFTPLTDFRDETQRDSVRLSTWTHAIRHNESYAGYLVTISRRSGASFVCIDGDQTVALEPVTLVINTPKKDWDIALSGGYTLSGLVNSSCTDDAEGGESKPCDEAKPGLVSFVHVYHDRLPWLAPMFGLGIGGGGQTQYHFGAGIRLGDVAAINGGLAVGPVEVGATDAPATVFKKTWFVGLSYSFVGGGDTIRQPFAGED